ncbi:MAG: phosphate ABC transporter substrate-binding protein [Gammaproteobacteria bacterium]|nr:phosphate ABC transporter substrate-binding protein [Gammaproteobacteria bacterium]
MGKVKYFTLLLSGVFFLISIPASWANETLQWAGCGITKKAFMAELAKAYTRKTGIKVELSGGGATKGIRSAAKGTIHIGGACRVVLDEHPEERDAFQIPVAWDALVPFVHPNNPVNNITFKQLYDVYLGKITNWEQLGGNNAPIELYIRRGKLSGVGRTIRELIFANYEQEFTAKYVLKSSGPVEKGVEKNPNGLAVTGVSSARKRNVKLLKLDGMSPSYENIKTGAFALYRPLYLVIKRGENRHLVRDFIKFAAGKEGQKIIRSQGTVPYADALHLVMKQLDQIERATTTGGIRSHIVD